MTKQTKNYSSESSARAAVRKDGLADFPHRIAKRIAVGGKVRHVPIFKPELAEDWTELSRRGWEVERG